MDIDTELSGRERLLQAAIDLAAEKRSLADVGVRELTRAAGLSPGAFYRHFADLDELGAAVVAQVETVLRSQLADLWQTMRGRRELPAASVQRYFALALANEAAFVVCARERYGASPTLREAMHALQLGLARELARELTISTGLARVPLAELEDAALDVIEHLNTCWLDYVVANRAGRERVLCGAEAFVERHFLGVLQRARLAEAAA